MVLPLLLLLIAGIMYFIGQPKLLITFIVLSFLSAAVIFYQDIDTQLFVSF